MGQVQHRVIPFLMFVVALIVPRSALAQQPDWAELASFHYSIAADVTYGYANNTALHLDVWQNQAAKGPVPTLMYIHGGGWMIGNKEGAVHFFLPYLERGWNVVNVEYRLGGNSLAPAAVEDSRCALRWIYNNAEHYHFDLNRIVVSGHSSGGHLALMVGMLPDGTALDSECPADADAPPLKVAAIVNWYGITDVNDLLEGPNRKTYAVAWIGANPNKQQLANEVSPITYVRSGLPPIITIHGNSDPTVPYSQAVRLQQALTTTRVANELVTIPGGVHGSYPDAETQRAFQEVWKFLSAHNIESHSDTTSAGKN